MFVNVFPQGGLHFSRKIDKLDSLDGFKIIVLGRAPAALIEMLGDAPLSLPLPAHYEALQRGTADGNMMMFMAFQPFKLAEVNSFRVNANLGPSGGWVFMMRKVFEGLSKAQQQLLMKNSGEEQTRAFGRFWDFAEARGRQIVSGDPKHEIVDLPPEVARGGRRRPARSTQTEPGAYPTAPEF